MPRTDSASRVIPVSRERVFTALTDRKALEAWLPPSGMTGRFEHFDFRRGGSYRLVLTYADANGGHGKATADTDVVEVRLVDVVVNERVVQEVDFVSDQPEYAGTMIMTWATTTVASGTNVEIRADEVPDGIAEEDHAAGMASSLANLAQYLGT